MYHYNVKAQRRESQFPEVDSVTVFECSQFMWAVILGKTVAESVIETELKRLMTIP